MKRAAVALGALALVVGALVGVRFSGATWTHDTNSTVDVQAAFDWTPPVISVQPLEPGIFATQTVTATVSDRSPLASVVLEFAPFGTDTWTSLTQSCTPLDGQSSLTYSCEWVTTTVPDGDYVVRARATDTATPDAYSAVSPVVHTQVANSPSVVLHPVASTVRGSVSLSASLYQPPNSTAKIAIGRTVNGSFVQLPGCEGQNLMTFTCTWDTTQLANGNHRLQAQADAGNTRLSDVQDVVVDNAAPTVSLSVPAAVLSGSVELAAAASDTHSAIAGVQFQFKAGSASTWTSCGTDTTSPYTCRLNTSALSPGSYDFRALATDAAGNVSAPDTATRDVSNAPASVSITNPVGGATVTGSVPVSVDAFSDRGVASVTVQYRRGSAAYQQACADTDGAPWGCTWSTGSLPQGGYDLRAVLTEVGGGGTVSSSPVPVILDATAGSVSLTGPAAGATLSGVAQLSATATYSGTIAKVEMRARPSGGVFTTVCEDATAAYSCDWDTTAIVWGDYDLQAVMTQDNGAVVTSASVPVSIDNVVGSVVVTGPATSLVRRTVQVTAEASSNANVTQVVLETRATPSGSFTPLCAATSAPFRCDWDTGAAGITYGTHEVRAVMTQGDGSTITSSGVTVTVDNRTFAGHDVQAFNGTGTLGLPDAGDRFELTWSGSVDLESLKPGFTGAATSVAVTFHDKQNVTDSPDDVAELGANLGRITFLQNYVQSQRSATWSATMTATEVTVAGAPVTRVTVTLDSITVGNAGDFSFQNSQQGTKALAWRLDTGQRNLFGDSPPPAPGGTVSESGQLDEDL